VRHLAGGPRGQRGESDDFPIRLAREFRRTAGFTEVEVDTIAEMASTSRAEREAELAAD
jgi:hypothetical protein